VTEAMPCLFSRDGSDVMLIVERDSDGASWRRRQLCVLGKADAVRTSLAPFYVWISPRKEFPEGRKILAAFRGKAI